MTETPGDQAVPDDEAVPEGETVLDIAGLTVEFGPPDGTAEGGGVAVDGIGLRVGRGDFLGIIGESGSGKSTAALAVPRLLPRGGRVTGGTVLLRGTEVGTLSERRLREIRGKEVGLVFQDPMSSLNPLLSIGAHLDEALRAHGSRSRAERRRRAAELLDLVGIPEAADRMGRRPHQFSGGQRQRVALAMALAGEPAVLIADEPTTALDATVGAQVLDLIGRVNRELGTAVVLITHDLSVVARSCRRVAVMYGGALVEQGPVDTVLNEPRHPYTAGLLAAVPRLDAPAGSPLAAVPGRPPALGEHRRGCRFAPRCHLATAGCRTEEPRLTPSRGRLVACHVTTAEPGTPAAPPAATPVAAPVLRAVGTAPPLLEVTGLSKHYAGPRRTRTTALSEVGLSLAPGETLGLVGESGSGKSTLARTLVGLERPSSGSLRFDGEELGAHRSARRRREIQLVFQDPYASLHPRMRIGTALAEPLRALGMDDRDRRRARVAELLRLVGLDESAAERRPADFSGGQRQRIGIARALATEPRLLLCDEPVSALDVSVQAHVLGLLAELRASLGLTMLFISHDLAVVRQISHRIAVLYRGEIVETGTADEVCARPRHPYTRSLLAAAGAVPQGPAPLAPETTSAKETT
ncbi:putative peptide ABC transporter, ATP-binding protein [Streptomyces albus]|uniref:Putative peptide ABC transporter, ATP-binding protein n=1 Tax=Streptomyces albus (strain ATCC 21838 / DSM 41398 / FERM P-419 / JCM 4703 / NBRC 107858) TaxID=1081613 RepID=A0A0B5END2_STRA4|nr:putative peptide ABC transporter, ATP-binding protein [Streptomyces albus]AOU78438.1 putative peptide ABC transporter, ATP-binding protein [Streptomyces albus]AYN34186.1 ABC transporter ATP-binding protein [Streptomyces albus]